MTLRAQLVHGSYHGIPLTCRIWGQHSSSHCVQQCMHLLTAMIQQRLKSPLARKVVAVVIHKVAAANPDSVALLKAQASGAAHKSMSFIRKGHHALSAAETVGTRPGLLGQTLISTGHADLDRLLGGGLPLGCVLLVLEDAWTPHGTTLLKHFAAEGAAWGHRLLWARGRAGASVKLPKLVVGKGAGEDDQKQEVEADKFQLRIAWQYRRYIKSRQRQAESAAEAAKLSARQEGSAKAASASKPAATAWDWCHQFDLTQQTPLEETPLQNSQAEAALWSCDAAASTASKSGASSYQIEAQQPLDMSTAASCGPLQLPVHWEHQERTWQSSPAGARVRGWGPLLPFSNVMSIAGQKYESAALQGPDALTDLRRKCCHFAQGDQHGQRPATPEPADPPSRSSGDPAAVLRQMGAPPDRHPQVSTVVWPCTQQAGFAVPCCTNASVRVHMCRPLLFSGTAALQTGTPGRVGVPPRPPQAAEQVPGLAPQPTASSHAPAGAAGSSPGFGDPVNIDRLPPRPVGRIAVHCLGGAAWQLGQQDGHHAEREVYRAMLTLKQAVRRSRCAAMVTVPRGMFSPSLGTRLAHLCDAVVMLEGVSDTSGLVRLVPDSASCSGVLQLLKLPSLNGLAPPVPETTSFIIRHRRRRLAIQDLNVSLLSGQHKQLLPGSLHADS
eukprot:jgi/Astpho2/10007/fgenesh1_pg.00153_%23_24_t